MDSSHLGSGVGDRQKNDGRVRYTNLESGYHGVEFASQMFFYDQQSNVGANIMPPPDYSTIGARPGVNYSIQTGEEFDLEFMRERVIPRPNASPNPLEDPNPETRPESSSSNLLPNAFKRVITQEFGRKGNPPQDSRASDRSIPKVKFLCSFGGAILPRPGDGKLRYVGGETRILRISKDVSWQELVIKIQAIYDQTHVIRYQLPGEDLDALVSVSCEEDLKNMMVECNIVEEGATEKPRMFLFSFNEPEDGQFGLGSVEGDSEAQYVVAVNSLDLGSRINSILASALPTNSEAVSVISPSNVNDSSQELAEGSKMSASVVGERNYGGSEADTADFCYPEASLVTPPVFLSERISREQAELNRLSKSHDFIGAQNWLKETEGALVSHVEPSPASLKQSYVNTNEMNDENAMIVDPVEEWFSSVSSTVQPILDPSEPGYKSALQGNGRDKDGSHHLSDSDVGRADSLRDTATGATAFERADVVVNIDEGFSDEFLYDMFTQAGIPQTNGFSLMDEIPHSTILHKDNVAVISTASGSNTLASHPDHGLPKPVGNKIVKLEVYPALQESESKATTLDIPITKVPPFDPSLGDVDISSLQIIKNEDLEELRELGSGTFGTVYHGKWRGTDVAIKRIKKTCFTGRSSEQERLAMEFWREADILSKLHHPNVVAFYGAVNDGPGGTLATLTEFMVNGSLRNVLLSKDRQLDHRKRLIIAMDAAFGMEYLHSRSIVHFDLKCDNLLVNLKDPSRPICKVADFGLSKMKRNTLVSGGVRGTLPWMAPELLNGGSNKVSEKVDVFSFGIVLWEILTGEEPYANMHYGAIIGIDACFRLIMQGGIVSNTLRPAVPSSCDPEWKRLMEQCWSPDPWSRPSFTEITKHLRKMSTSPKKKPDHQPHKEDPM